MGEIYHWFAFLFAYEYLFASISVFSMVAYALNLNFIPNQKRWIKLAGYNNK